MVSQHTVSIAVLSCIALAISTPIISSENQGQCLQISTENDQFLYQSFESLQKWVNSKLSMKEEQILLLIKNLENSMQLNKQEIVQMLTKYQETSDAKKLEMEQVIKGNLDEVQNSLKELKGQMSEFSNVDQQIKEVREAIRGELQGQIGRIDQQAATIQDVSNRVSQCVTDIKVSPKETNAIHYGLGYGDEANLGYVMTGVSNSNRDQWVDQAYRRKILFLRNNAWTPLHE